MRRLYSTCLRAQYGLWTLYALGVVSLYVLGFFVDTVNLRWSLIPVTLVMLPVGGLLAIVIVGLFMYETVLKTEINQNDRPSVLSVLPSMMFLTAMSLLVWA